MKKPKELPKHLTREYLIEQITTLHNSMFNVFLRIGVPRKNLAFKNRNFEKCSLDKLVHALAWLRYMEENDYGSCREIVGNPLFNLNKSELFYSRISSSAKENWRKRPTILSLEYKE